MGRAMGRLISILPSMSWTTAILVGAPVLLGGLSLLLRKFKAPLLYVIDFFVYHFSRLVRRTISRKSTARLYCRLQLNESTAFLQVPARDEILLPIDRIFIPLNLEQATTKELADHTTLLNFGTRIRVVGDPGSGKSSLSKRLFRDECNRTLRAPARGRLPLLLALRDLKVPRGAAKPNPENWLYTRLLDMVKGIGVFDIQSCFEAYLSDSGVLLILDGLDEVSTVDYPFIEAAILSLSNRLSRHGTNNIIIITMRLQFHLHVRESYSTTFPIVFSVKPFSPTDVYEFLARWPFAHNRWDTVLRIYSDLHEHPNLRDLCSNPLILAMYVANDLLSREGDAPETRTTFYKTVTDELLLKRRQRQSGQRGRAAAATLNERYRLLGSIALEADRK